MIKQMVEEENVLTYLYPGERLATAGGDNDSTDKPS